MAIQSFACFHINFLLPMSGAAAYLTLRRRLLSKILTSLYTAIRWGPYLQSCQWGFNMGKFKLYQISYPVVHCENRSLHTFYYINQGQRSKVKRFSQESAHKQTNGRTDGQTDRRTLPSTLSPSFAVDNDSLSTWVHLIMTLKIGI